MQCSLLGIKVDCTGIKDTKHMLLLENNSASSHHPIVDYFPIPARSFIPRSPTSLECNIFKGSAAFISYTPCLQRWGVSRVYQPVGRSLERRRLRRNRWSGSGSWPAAVPPPWVFGWAASTEEGNGHLSFANRLLFPLLSQFANCTREIRTHWITRSHVRAFLFLLFNCLLITLTAPPSWTKVEIYRGENVVAVPRTTAHSIQIFPSNNSKMCASVCFFFI